MADPGSGRVLLIEEDSNSATVTRDLLDVASSGLVELIHVERLHRAVQGLTTDAFDVILFRALALGQAGPERIDRLLLQAPGVPVIVLALLADADLRCQ